MIFWIFIFIFVLSMILSIISILVKDLLYSVLSLALLSLITSILFLILNAPDVAITEAAVGAALTTVIYIFGIRRTKREDE
ncbi:MAG: hydrogenase subunit MbhD domain-containing protein [candidate division WOR-3 bacterium]